MPFADRAAVGACSELFVEAEQFLLQAEDNISLLDAFAPLNFEAERTRIEGLLARSAVSLPRFEYRRERQRAVQLALRQIASARELLALAGDKHLLSVLLSERADELHVESRLVAARGTEQVSALGAERYVFSEREIACGAELAETWFEEALSLLEAEQSTTKERVTLASVLVNRSRRAGYSFRIVEREMPSIAAVGGDCLYVRKNASVAPHIAERVWVHEVGAHLLPRLSAKQLGPPFRVGSASSNEDEEGRAILFEERSGLLGSARKLELSLRFKIALAARSSTSQASTLAHELVKRGAAPPQVAEALCRASRGGGLAREVSYLAGFLRVKEALEQEPKIEVWMGRGRISVSAARRLQCADLIDHT